MADKRLTTPGNDRTYVSFMSNQTQHMPVGWCNYRKHRGKLSLKQMKSHECLKKQCKYLKKNDNHPYWNQREQNKQAKKARKFETRFSEILEEEIKKAINNALND